MALDEVELAVPFGLDEADDEDGDDDLEERNDLARLLADVEPFGLLLLPFKLVIQSSSLHMNISSQCSSFKIESYVTHNAGP